MDENPYESPHALCKPQSDDVTPPRRLVDDLTPENLAIAVLLCGAALYSMDAFSLMVWFLVISLALRSIYWRRQSRRAR